MTSVSVNVRCILGRCEDGVSELYRSMIDNLDEPVLRIRIRLSPRKFSTVGRSAGARTHQLMRSLRQVEYLGKDVISHLGRRIAARQFPDRKITLSYLSRRFA